MNSPHIHQGEELVNAALGIIDHWNGWVTGDPPRCTCAIRGHDLATEFGDMQERGQPVEADTDEAQAIYFAAMAVVARWYGVADVSAFARYLANYAARRGDQ